MHTSRRRRRQRLLGSLAFFLIMALVAAACGGGGDEGESGGADEGEAAPAEAAVDADGVIRMVLAPDPVWDWLSDQGIREEMEQEAGIQILASPTWDEFGVYAGGHADVVSAAAYEVPELEEATGIPTTVFGKYNSDRSTLGVRADSDYQDLCDLEGQTIVSLSAVSITIMWGVYAQQMCGLDLSAEGGDFDLVVTDIQNMAGLVEQGDAEACLCLPDFSIQQYSSGALRPLYDGRSAAEIFADDFGDGHDGPQTNVFLAPTAWIEQNPEEAQFLLAVWERGLQEWQEHRDEIIDAYPQHFAAETDEDKQFIKDWLDNNYDWFEDSVYMDEEWVEGETQIFNLMKEAGFLAEDAEEPNFEVFEPQ
ncbi:MAG: ABC transporter substrate-binding protein [Nitriliruptorales bacterium]|nr:ABC transporter substrate-binding protein [Nitriliruptorales bacterium]